MSTETCFLTTRDFAILEAMLDRCLERDDPLAPILKRKIESALVMHCDDIPRNVATSRSRITFRVDGRDLDTRVIASDPMTSATGLFLPLSTQRGLALLGLAEGQEFRLTQPNAIEERIVLEKVHYQPEAARRETQATNRLTEVEQIEPALRLIRGALYDQPRFVPANSGGFDDPGPSAA